DDCSQDGTAEAARRVPGLWLTVLTGQSLPAGWAGKLWALEQGFRQVNTRYTLLLDADIQLEPGVIVDLLNIARGCDRSLVSVMAALPMWNFWEALLTPAFIYFFKMLYPFHLANSPSRRFASAAGGCMLVDTRVLRDMGGFEPIRGALIDDCALAARFKSQGSRTWTGLSRRVISRRRYHGLGDIWDMVARSAFTQLRYSSLLLLATTLALVVLFWAPFLGLLAGKTWTQLIGAGAYLLMTLTYLPTIRFYRLVWLWALALPLSATLYLGMTWSSALRYWRGSRSTWKQRTYN
ncbi:MAG: glycosyltransferase, partial [Anaerolineales bacterium]|nr:glycosyltransferase [Anaerolineales bacterium]